LVPRKLRSGSRLVVPVSIGYWPPKSNSILIYKSGGGPTTNT
jgi:hypothetical protein